jgi:hypothetical protein
MLFIYVPSLCIVVRTRKSWERNGWGKEYEETHAREVSKRLISGKVGRDREVVLRKSLVLRQSS